jgi:hypothetical protein
VKSHQTGGHDSSHRKISFFLVIVEVLTVSNNRIASAVLENPPRQTASVGTVSEISPLAEDSIKFSVW